METTFTLRLPRDLKDWVEDRSIRHHRSMNKELVAILAAIRAGEETDVPGEGFHRFAT
jgi:plasmid stability protein